MPSYRVYFWVALHESGPSSDTPRPSWESEEWRVDEADIEEVLRWASAHRPKGTQAVQVFCDLWADGVLAGSACVAGSRNAPFLD